MSVNDAINRLKTESKSILEAREVKQRAKDITEGRTDYVPCDSDNPKLKRIAAAYKKMDTAYWEEFLKKQNDGLDNCTEENREEYIEKCVYEYKRQEAIYNGYGSIIKEPHRMDELLVKLKKKLKRLDEEYDNKTQEQMRIEGT